MRLDVESDPLTRLLMRADPRLGWMYRDATHESARSARRAAWNDAFWWLTLSVLVFVPLTRDSLSADPFGRFLERGMIATFALGTLLTAFLAGAWLARARYVRLVATIKEVLAANEPPRPEL